MKRQPLQSLRSRRESKTVRSSGRHRQLRLEPLEDRRLLAMTPVTLEFLGFLGRDPDDLQGDGDYYPFFRIGDNPPQYRTDLETTGDGGDYEEIHPNWTFTEFVDLAASPITIWMGIADEDSHEIGGGPDDIMDINPLDGVLSITVQLDLFTGDFTGDWMPAGAKNIPFAEGDGDEDHFPADEGGYYGLLIFDIDVPYLGGDDIADTDGDGLCDEWETYGIDFERDGITELTLYGADPRHKDLYVEVDAMLGRGPKLLPPIERATDTSPIQITSRDHGLTTGARVRVYGVEGNEAANGIFTVTRVNNDRFTLDGSTGGGTGDGMNGRWNLADVEADTIGVQNTTLELVMDAFLRAPVANPDGETGIRLHIDHLGEEAPLQSWDTDVFADGLSPYGEDLNANGNLDFGEDRGNGVLDPGEDLNNNMLLDPGEDLGNGVLDPGDADEQWGWQFFRGFKQLWFGNPAQREAENWQGILAAKALAYRYCVFADLFIVPRPGVNAGVESSTSGNQYNRSDFVVTLGRWIDAAGSPGGTPAEQAGTFMHELGHTLGLGHGGGDGINFKPNYHSVMNYIWQTPDSNFSESWELDYSEGTFRTLFEDNLSEVLGMRGHAGHRVPVAPQPDLPAAAPWIARLVPESGPIDWDGDGLTDNFSAVVDINRLSRNTPASPGEILSDFNDWGRLQFSIGTDGFSAGAPDLENLPLEMTLEIFHDMSGLLFYQMPQGNGPDSLTLRRDGDQLVIIDNRSGNVVAQRLAIDTLRVEIAGAAGEDDTLIVQCSGGDPVPVDGVQFDGRGGSGVDTLTLSGHTVPAAYTPDESGLPDRGALTVPQGTIRFENLERVRPIAPTIVSLDLSAAAIDEGETVSLSGEFLDPGLLASHQVFIDWGDGSSSTLPILALGSRSFSAMHHYEDDNPSGTPFDENLITVTIVDDDQLDGQANETVRVTNLAPRIGNWSVTSHIDEGGEATLSGSFSDASPRDTFVLRVDWGDGVVQEFPFAAGSTSFVQTHRYDDDNPSGTAVDAYPIRVTLRDDDGGSDSDLSGTLVMNVAPGITEVVLSSDAIDEGQTAVVTGSFSDPALGIDTFTGTALWSDGVSTPLVIDGAAGTFRAQRHFPDDNPTGTPLDPFTVHISIRDDDLGSDAADSPVLTVRNVAPSIGAVDLSSDTINEGQIVVVTGGFSDPALGIDTFAGTALWSDGASTPLVIDGANGTFRTERHFPDDDPTGTPLDRFTVNIAIADDDLGSDMATSDVLSVRNVAPTITAIGNSAGIPGDQGEDEAVTVTMQWSDPGLPDTFTAQIDWGDGSDNTYDYGQGTRSLSESHAYDAGGIYLITVTLTDDDTGQAVQSTTAYITGVGIVGHRLYVIGTNGADQVTINPGARDEVRVQASFLPERQRFLPAAGVQQIVILLCDGNDTATVAGSILLPVQIQGGGGHDRLNGGGGLNVLLGGLGDDVLVGGSSHDLLIGGDGGDSLQANGGRNIVIAGSTAYDGVSLSQLDYLFGLLDDFADDAMLRPDHRLDTSTVFDDGFVDELLGVSPLDLLFYELGRDRVRGRV